MRIKLSCRGGTLSGKAFEFETLPVSIGRGPGNQVQFDPSQDRVVSTQHCQLLEQNGQLFIRDAGSKHGTLVNGLPIAEAVLLPHGAVIQLGRKGPELVVDAPDALPRTMEPDRLVCLSGSLAGQSFELASGALGIGRAASSQIRFDAFKDPLVSSQHCEVFKKGQDVFVRDLGSKHGVLLNGNPVTDAVRVPANGVIRLGKHGPELMLALAGQSVMPRTLDSIGSAPEKPGAARPAASQPQGSSSGRRGKRALASIGLVLGMAALAGFSFWIYLNSLFAESKVNAALRKNFGADAGVKAAKIHWPDSLELLNLRIPSATGGSEPALSVNGIELGWDPWELLTKTRINRLVLQEPRAQLARNKTGEWNLRLPAGGGSAGVSFEQARVLFNNGELAADWGSGAFWIKQLNGSVSLPDSNPNSPLRINSISAALGSPAGKLSGVIASRNILCGPLNSASSQFEGSLDLSSVHWDSGRGWSVDLPQGRLAFDGSLGLAAEDKRQLTLRRLELEDIGGLKDLVALWNPRNSRLNLQHARMQADLNALRKLASNLPGLEFIAGKAALEFKDGHLALPAEDGSAYKLTCSIQKPEAERSLGVHITPRGLDLAEIEELNAQVELQPQAVTIPQAGLKLNFGSSATGSVSFASKADLQDKAAPVWLQMLTALEHLNMDIPLGGVMQSQFVQRTLESGLLLDGRLMATQAKVAAAPAALEEGRKSQVCTLSEISIKDLEVLRWPAGWLWLDRPDGKFAADLRLWAEFQNNTLKTLGLGSHLESGKEAGIRADVRTEIAEKTIKLSNAAAKLPLAKIVQMLPLLKSSGLNLTGQLELKDGACEWQAGGFSALSGALHFSGVDASFSLGEKCPVPGGVAGFRNLDGVTAVSIAQSPSGQQQLKIKGRLFPAAAGKAIEFYSPGLAIKSEPIEAADFEVTCDLAAINGKREAALNLKWQSAGEPGFFTAAGSFSESGRGQQAYEISLSVSTSLLGGFSGSYRGFFDAERKAWAPLAVRINKAALPGALLPLRQTGLFAEYPDSALAAVQLKNCSLQVAGAESGPARYWDPNAMLTWRLSGTIGLDLDPAMAQFYVQVQQRRGEHAWSIERADVELHSPLPFSRGAWRIRFPKEWTESSKFRGALAIGEDLSKATVQDSTEVLLPACEVLPPGLTDWISLPKLKCRMGRGKMETAQVNGQVVRSVTVTDAGLDAPGLFSIMAAEGRWHGSGTDDPAKLPSAEIVLSKLDCPDLRKTHDWIANILTALLPEAEWPKKLGNYDCSGSLAVRGADGEKSLSMTPDGVEIKVKLQGSQVSVKPKGAGPTEDFFAAKNLTAELSLGWQLLPENPGRKIHAGAALDFDDLTCAGCRFVKAGSQPPLVLKAIGSLAATGPHVQVKFDPLSVNLPRMDIACLDDAGRALSSPAMTAACQGAFSRVGGSTRDTWAAESFIVRCETPGADACWLEFGAQDARLQRSSGKTTGVQLNGGMLRSADLRWIARNLLQPNLKRWLPAATALDLSGSASASELALLWRPDGWAVTALLRPEHLNAALTGTAAATAAIDDLSGCLPAAFSSADWPQNWRWEKQDRLSFKSVRLQAPLGNATLACALPQATLSCVSKPNEARLTSPLRAEFPGGSLTLTHLAVQAPFQKNAALDFGFAAEADLNDCARKLGWNPAVHGLDFAAHRPILKGTFPACRIARQAGDAALFQIGPQAGASGEKASLVIAPAAHPDRPALSVNGIQMTGFHAPGFPDNADIWQAQRAAFQDIRFGNLGVLFPALGTIDLSLSVLLKSFHTTGAAPETVLGNLQPFVLELATPGPRENPHWNISLTDAMKDRLCSALDLGGIERWFIFQKKTYDFRQIGIGIKLQNGLLIFDPKIRDAQTGKRCFVQGKGTFDPSIDTGKIPPYFLVLPWEGLCNAILTAPVRLEEFLGRIKPNLKVEQWKKLGWIGETADGHLEIRSAPATADAPVDAAELKTENSVREAIYQWAAGEYFKPQPAAAGVAGFRAKRLDWIKAKAGRLNRDKAAGDKNYAACWVQHPLTGAWVRAGELRQQMEELFNRETGAAPVPNAAPAGPANGI